MSELINLALRRNIFYPTAKIYSNSPAGFFDYGPIGLKIKNNIVEFWRKEFVEANNGLEIDGCQILPKAVFEASGHVANFADSVVKCKKCGETINITGLEKPIEVVCQKCGAKETLWEGKG